MTAEKSPTYVHFNALTLPTCVKIRVANLKNGWHYIWFNHGETMKPEYYAYDNIKYHAIERSVKRARFLGILKQLPQKMQMHVCSCFTHGRRRLVVADIEMILHWPEIWC